jgi:hypothetical protein
MTGLCLKKLPTGSIQGLLKRNKNVTKDGKTTSEISCIAKNKRYSV